MAGIVGIVGIVGICGIPPGIVGMVMPFMPPWPSAEDAWITELPICLHKAATVVLCELASCASGNRAPFGDNKTPDFPVASASPVETDEDGRRAITSLSELVAALSMNP